MIHLYIAIHICMHSYSLYVCMISVFISELQNGRVYICDLSEIMDGLPCKEGCYCPAPICLLYVNEANNLVPIAIQLKKAPGPDNPIFLPTDKWFDWTLAKIYYRSADAQVCTCT